MSKSAVVVCDVIEQELKTLVWVIALYMCEIKDLLGATVVSIDAKTGEVLK